MKSYQKVSKNRVGQVKSGYDRTNPSNKVKNLRADKASSVKGNRVKADRKVGKN